MMIEISKEDFNKHFLNNNSNYIIVWSTECGRHFVSTASSFEDVEDWFDNAQSGRSAVLSVIAFSKI